MNGPVWIEQLNHLHRVTQRTRLEGDTLRLGRGYGNDLVLDDPRVAPAHLVIHVDPQGGLTARAEGEHTLIVEGNRTPQREARIDGDSILRIGHTRLRVRTADYPVPERMAAERMASPLPYVLSALPLLALVLFMALEKWLTNADASPYWRTIPEQLPILFLVFIWAGGWTLASRMLGHRGRFGTHLLIASTGLFAIGLPDNLMPPLLYSLSLTPPFFLQGLLASQLGVLLLYVHVSALGERFQPASYRNLILALLAMGATVTTISLIDHEDKGSPPSVAVSYPPGLRLIGAKSLEQVMEELNGLEQEARATLDEPVPEKLR